ncbi:16S rRNA (guanine(966)-N(2))-methyltransferase RsmD [Chloroflexota bacterium]
MRVISGSARGRKLQSVPGDSTRPITDRVKESLFNIVGPDIHKSTFLDLFAGTGSVGIEALSRGASSALFIDVDQKAIKTIRANLDLTGLTESGQVLRGEALTFLERPANVQFDYIYIAPPQYKGLWKEALESLDHHIDWLSSDAWVIVQIHPREFEPLDLEHLKEFDRRSYGSTTLIFFQDELI